ncbi:hypothetical protein O7623_04280 [Solwaraspora sp. WMMD791]|uniref:hypothetical protein n=1 Tax=Solwaraspora sp. WMMD791 TaxID=3016086 RepID=UPI002499D4BA|nr:hypothetical protein [Solwaraspora sp. WMMD791]WFE28438.1 hypothetical protein O7623_04280 [Solwaraspora sp. WMMD791]
MALPAPRRLTAGLLSSVVCVLVSAAPAAAAPGGGIQADGFSTPAGISADGRYALFTSTAANLVVSDGTAQWHLFVRDLHQAVTSLVDVTADGEVPTAAVTGPAQLSLSGRYAVFASAADDLTVGDGAGTTDVYLRDLHLQATDLISVAADGTAADGWSTAVGVSADGRYVVFQSTATNLVSGGTAAGARHLYVRDRAEATTRMITAIPADSLAPGWTPVASPDGLFVGYDLRTGDGRWVTYLHDVVTGGTTTVGTSTIGDAADATTFAQAISRGGQFVLFQSTAANLVRADTNDAADLFVHNPAAGRTVRVSLADGGDEADRGAGAGHLSATGRYVAFESTSTNLTGAPATDDVTGQVYLRDREAGRTWLVSAGADGTPANGTSRTALLSGNGRFVLFGSDATDLVPGDTNAARDVFRYDHSTGTTSRVSVG